MRFDVARCRRSLTLALAVTVGLLAAGCSNQERSDTIVRPPNSVDGRLLALDAGGDLPAGEMRVLVAGTHCGVRVLGPIVNDVSWITDEATTDGDWMPIAWAEAIEGGQELIALEVLLSDDGTYLTATAELVSVRYRPVVETDEVPGCM